MKYSLPAEPDLKNEYRQTGGCRWGSWNATWPFATLRCSVEALAVTIDVLGFRRVFEFSPKDVVAICKMSGFFSRGIQIEHRKLDYPQYIVFWSFNRRELLRMVRLAGFTADEP